MTNGLSWQDGWGFNQERSGIQLDIYYFGNCLTNLENYNSQNVNYYTVTPVDWDSFSNSLDDDGLNPDSKFWIVRGTEVELIHNAQSCADAGIEIKRIC